MKKATHSEEQSRPRKADHINPAEVLANAPTKASRVLAYLLMPGHSLMRFEALKLGDYCLPSTISAFTNMHDLAFEHIPEQVQNNWGNASNVTRYRLPESQREKALALLAQMVAKRKPAKEVDNAE